MALIDCKECGKQISEMAAACPHCGAPTPNAAALQRPTVVTATKSRSLAVLLALFLGGVGIHKFYLRSPGWGALYLLFCWTFIPAIIAVLEAIFYLCMSDAAFEYRYSS